MSHKDWKSACGDTLSVKLHTILMKEKQSGLWIERLLHCMWAEIFKGHDQKPRNEYKEWWRFVQVMSERQKLRKNCDLWTTFRTSEKTQNSVWSKLKSKNWQKQMPWVNGFKATQKPLAFIFSAKENDFMNRKGRTNGSIKKLSEGQTAEQTEWAQSFTSPTQEHCIRTARPCKWHYWATFGYLGGSCEKWVMCQKAGIS